MICPHCQHDKSHVFDSRRQRMGGGDIRVVHRRRRCFACHKPFSTYEIRAEDLDTNQDSTE